MKKFIIAVAMVLSLLLFGCQGLTDAASSDNAVGDKGLDFKVNEFLPEYSVTVVYNNIDPQLAEALIITEKGTSKQIQKIELTENEFFSQNPVYAVDVTFDSNADLLVPYTNTASAVYFQAYVWQESERLFRCAPSFRNIPNFVIDRENELILSKHTASKITSYSVSSYDKDEKDFIVIRSVYWEPDVEDAQMHFVEENYGENGETSIVNDFLMGKVGELDINKTDPKIAPYFKDDSLWDLDGARWDATFYKP